MQAALLFVVLGQFPIPDLAVTAKLRAAPRIQPRGIKYTITDVPLWYQGEEIVGGRSWYAFHEHPSSRRPITNPNHREPWRRPAGTEDVQGLQATRWIDVPQGKYVVVWTRRIGYEMGNSRGRPGEYRFGSGSHDHWYWRFPVGTTLFERLSTEQEGAFVLRARKKVSNTGNLAEDWEGDEEFLQDPPPGYRFVQRDCIDCHQDAGQHVSRLPETEDQDWYQYLRGGLKDRRKSSTVFTFRPVNQNGQVLPIFRSIVKKEEEL